MIVASKTVSVRLRLVPHLEITVSDPTPEIVTRLRRVLDRSRLDYRTEDDQGEGPAFFRFVAEGPDVAELVKGGSCEEAPVAN